MPEPSDQRQSSKKLLVVLVAALNLVFAVIGWIALQDGREHVIEKVRISAENYADLLGQSFQSTGQRVDLALQAVSDDLQRMQAAGIDKDEEIEALLARYSARLPEVDAIRVTDVDGTVRWGKGVDRRNLRSYADRDFYAELRQAPDKGMIVTAPIQGKVTGLWTVAFVRALRHRDGSFAGVVSAAILADSLNQMLAGLQLGPHGSAELRHASGHLMARFPGDKGLATIGSLDGMANEFARLLKAGAPRGLYQSPDSGDGQEQIQAYRRVQALPLAISVGLSQQDHLDDWRSGVGYMVAFLLTFVAASVFAVWSILQVWQRQAAAHAALRDSEAMLREAQHVGRIGSYSFDFGANRWRSSATLDEIFGIGADHDRSMEGWLSLIHPDERDKLATYVSQEVIGKGLAFDLQYRINNRTREGVTRWVHGRGAVQHDAQGRPCALIGTIQDITERRRAEVEL
ncbi:MAG: hypothetical protein RJA44_2211, partial [Pseudomonadota bacterium]